MTEERMRTFDFEGKRRGIRLDEGTWQSIDWLAGQRGVKWTELACEWATLGGHGPHGDTNLTRVIRAAAIQSLLSETIFAERADMHGSSGPIWASLGMCDDRGFQEAMNEAEIEGAEDFVGFKLAAGVNEFGNVTFYIENNVKDCPSLIISTPFSRTEWTERQGGEQ